MIRPSAVLAAVSMLLAGCASAPQSAAPAPTPSGGTSCDAAKAQFAIGRIYAEPLAEQARAAANALRVRRLEPGKAYTMEFDEGRLNLEVDANGAVTAARCG